MSCSSCNKKNSVKKYSIDSDSLNFLDTLNFDTDSDKTNSGKTDDGYINDMYDLYNDLDKISLKEFFEKLKSIPDVYSGQNLIICGCVRSGKSNLLVNLLTRSSFYNDMFDSVTIISPTSS